MTKEINPATLWQLFVGNDKCDGFTMIEDEITSSDPEDGGADHEYVIQEDSTKKFYAGDYRDWDIDNTDYDEETHTCGDRIDFNNELQEVFPKTKIITVYE